MATRSLGTLTLDLIAKVGSFEGGLSKADRAAKSKFKNIEKNVNKAAKTFVAFGAAAVGVATLVINATTKQENAIKQLEARLTSTRGVAGKTSEELQGLATSLQRVSTFGDESVIEMESLLLTFTNIRGEIFDRTVPAVLDMSIALGTDLKSSAIQLGKALNDPILGISALSRSGIQFSEDQKKVIKSLVETGRTAEAQTIILKELETQFGGAAAAAADTFGGSITQLKNAFGDLLEAPGGLDEAKESVQDLTEFLQDPKTIQAAGELTTALISGFKSVAESLRTTIELTGFLTEAFTGATQGLSADDVVRLEDNAEQIRELLRDENLFGKINRLKFFGPKGVIEYYNEDELKSELQELESAIADFYTAQERRNRLLLGLDEPIAPEESPLVQDDSETPIFEIPNQKIEEAIEKLEQQVELLGKSKIEQELFKLETEGASDAQIELARQALNTIEAFELEADATKAIKEEMDALNEKAQAIADSLRTEEEAIEESYQRRRDIILRNTEITGQAQTDLLLRLEEQRQEQLEEIESENQLKRLESQAKILEGTEMLFDSLSDIAREFAGEQSTVFKALFAVEKAAAIARSIVAIQTGLAEAAANPFPANLGAIASVAAATAGIISTITSTNIQGQADAGIDRIPRSGTYLLEQGERITTAETSEKLDRTLAEIQSQMLNGPMGSDMALQIGSMVIQAPTERAGKNAAYHVQRRLMGIINQAQRAT